MEKITIKFKRIFDIFRGHYGRGGPKCTTFGFEYENNRIFSVVVDGWPDLPEGSTVTALLEIKNDWSTLAGWVNHTTGKILIAKPSASFIVVYLCTIIYFIWLCFILNNFWVFKIQKTFMFTLLLGTFICGVVVLFMYRRAIRYKKNSEVLHEMQKQFHSQPSF